MPPRKRKAPDPFTVTVDGRQRLIVHTSKDTWVEREDSGRLVIHLGQLLTDGQEPSKWIDPPRPCSRCKQPTYYATPRGRPIHPACEGWLNTLPDQLAAQVTFGVAVDLNARIL